MTDHPDPVLSLIHIFGNKPAVGLCGSGLIDLVAGLLDAGMLDENGVLRSGQEKQGVFILVPPERGGNERGVYLTQKDLGEVQLAKAAIAAGIQMLMERLGITAVSYTHLDVYKRQER